MSYQTSLENAPHTLSSEMASAMPDYALRTIQGLAVPPGELVAQTGSADYLAASAIDVHSAPKVASSGVDLHWLTGTTQGLSTAAWETLLNPSLKSAVDAQATSIYRAEQTIVSQALAAGSNACYMPAGVEGMYGIFAIIVGIAAVFL
jgi:hypothetical protein